MLDTFQKSNLILSQCANITSSKLSFNQELSLSKNSIELYYNKSKRSDIEEQSTIVGYIKLPKLCNQINCSDSYYTLQVC